MADENVTKIARFDVNPANSHVQRFGAHLHLITLIGRLYELNQVTAIDPATVREGDYPARQAVSVPDDPIFITGQSTMLLDLARLVQTVADTGKPVVTTTYGRSICVEPLFCDEYPSQMSVLSEPSGPIAFRGSPECLLDLAQNITFASTNVGHLHLDSVASFTPDSSELILAVTDAK
jgi:hypothetical protein